MSLAGLPSGGEYLLEFDLYLLGTWDGNYVPIDPLAGPDEFGVQISGGPTLLHSTFSNFPTNWPYDRQAYPGPYPGGSFPGQTGAAERDTLGWTGSIDPSDLDRPSIDSVYHFEFVFSHAQEDIALRFFGNMQDYGVGASLFYESWGLDNVQLSAVPEPATILLIAGAAPLLGYYRIRRRRRLPLHSGASQT